MIPMRLNVGDKVRMIDPHDGSHAYHGYYQTGVITHIHSEKHVDKGQAMVRITSQAKPNCGGNQPNGAELHFYLFNLIAIDQQITTNKFYDPNETI